MDNASVETTGPQPKSMWKSQVFWFVVILNLIFGGVFNYLPVTFPVFKRVFGSTLEQMGRTQFLFFIGGLVFSICGGWVVGRLRLKRASIVTVLGLAISLVLIGAARSFAMVLIGSFCFGLSLAAIVVVFSAIISEGFPGNRQSLFFLTGVLDGLGATFCPALLGKWFTHAEHVGASWRSGYFVTAAVIGIVVIWAMLLPSEALPDKVGEGQSASAALSEMKDILVKPAIYGIGLAYFLHSLSQCGMISFVGQLYQRRLHIDTAHAAYLISLNSAGFFVGRSLMSWVTSRWKISELLVLGVSAAGGTIAFVLTILSPSYVGGLVMFAFAGAFISGDGPSINSYTGTRFVGQTATAFALLGGIGNVGGAIGPYLVGIVGTYIGLEKGIWLMPVFSLCLAALSFGWFARRRSLRKQMVDVDASSSDVKDV